MPSDLPDGEALARPLDWVDGWARHPPDQTPISALAPPWDAAYPPCVSISNVNDDAIAAALSKLVDDGIEAGAFVILEPEASDGSNYYIQFALDSDRLYCEAVSNEYLEPPYTLDDEQMGVLENLGWRPPEHEGQNWFRTFRPSSPEDYDEIVALVHRVWLEVYL